MLRSRSSSLGSRATFIFSAALGIALSCAACDARGNGSGEGAAQSLDAPGAPAAAAMREFPPTSQEGTVFAQITPKRPLDLSSSGGSLGFEWGGPGRPGSAPGSYYYPQDRDFDRTHDAGWY
ncbi:hypothetical protein, partial [Sphingomonas sp.]|uniref:hypothetical protein n=1 Tax=Sphingomonas sp. TaxID=28214 RepID=UPI0025D4BA7A